jgi:hypothetical protein
MHKRKQNNWQETVQERGGGRHLAPQVGSPPKHDRESGSQYAVHLINATAPIQSRIPDIANERSYRPNMPLATLFTPGLPRAPARHHQVPSPADFCCLSVVRVAVLHPGPAQCRRSSRLLHACHSGLPQDDVPEDI